MKRRITSLFIVTALCLMFNNMCCQAQSGNDKASTNKNAQQKEQNKKTTTSTAKPITADVPSPVIEVPQIETEEEDNCIYDAPQVMASYPGGENALYTWVGKNIKYPPRCQELSIQGRVMVKFVVEKDGSIGAVQVLRSPDDDLSKEAVRVIKSMPKWNPAKQQGKAVRAYFTLPVMFRLAEPEKKQETTLK